VNARKAVVLAAGGFGCNKEMVARYYGPQADLSASRSVPYNDATAILAAQRLGAMLSRGMTGFYGHLQPFPVLLPQTPEDFDAFDKNLFNAIGGSIQSFTSRAIVVNQDGLRFADESLGDEQVAQGVLRQRHATCWTIFDSSAVPTPDRLKTLQTQKAVLLTADTLDDLIGKIGPYGVHTINLAQTLADFNKAAQEKAGGRMTPAHGGTLAAITRAPFFGIQVTAGISGTYGGLKINTKGQVLGPCSLPIPGLYAAPHTAGGIFYETYGGSLGGCAVWGRIAGTNAGAEKSV
jgi:succinate dehydrogenase/fumarate reductase flavoprotein subunit